MEKEKKLGQKVLETHEEHLNSTPIEAGDLAHEGYKSYMKNILEVVEQHRGVIDEYYIQVISSKPREYLGRAISFKFVARESKPEVEDDMDCWYVNNKKDILHLEWSLPHWSEFDLILANEDNDSKQTAKWIRAYRTAEKSRSKIIQV